MLEWMQRFSRRKEKRWIVGSRRQARTWAELHCLFHGRRASAKILILAEIDGAEKINAATKTLSAKGNLFYDLDRAARHYREHGLCLIRQMLEPGSKEQSHSSARFVGHAFKTTLGGATISTFGLKAVNEGSKAQVWYVGLVAPDPHNQCVHE